MSKPSRWNDLQVGILVLAALAVLVIGSLWLAGRGLSKGAAAVYRVAMDSSGGLRPGAAVRIAGVDVGRVSTVTLQTDQEWPVTFDVQVDETLPLFADASARIASAGVFGDNFLEIDPGTPGSGPFAGSATLYGRAGPGMDEGLQTLTELGDQASVLLERTSELVEQLSTEITPLVSRVELLLSDENLAAIDDVLAGLNQTLDETAPRIGPLLARMDAVTASAEQSLEGMPRLSSDLQALVGDLRAALGPDGERLRDLLENANAGIEQAESSMSVLGDNRDQIDASLRDLRRSLANMAELSQTLRDRPYSLIRIRPEPDRKPGGR